MKRCTRIGLNVTKSCNWRCNTCFYKHEQGFFTPEHETLQSMVSQIEKAKQRGLDHIVLVGYGEPSLWPHLPEFVKQCKAIGMASSIITNGTATPAFYESLYADGLDHIHISVHGKGDILNKIAHSQVAAEKQAEVLKWLKQAELPWRSNTTLQLDNYQTLPEITEYVLDHGCRHVVLLGFLPHYGWHNRLREVAVEPAALRPFIEESMDKVIDRHQWLTLRYHPMCHLRTDLWKYVTNADFVLLDPGEWEYNNSATMLDESLKKAAWELGQNVAIKTEPCINCDLYKHCGGWNATYAAGFDGAALEPYKCGEYPQSFGYLWYQNPFNTEFKGHFTI